MHPLLPELSRLERWVLYSDGDFGDGSFAEQCGRFREYLRTAIAERQGAHVEIEVEPAVAAIDWREVLEGYTVAELAAFVELFGEQSELAVAIAAL